MELALNANLLWITAKIGWRQKLKFFFPEIMMSRLGTLEFLLMSDLFTVILLDPDPLSFIIIRRFLY